MTLSTRSEPSVALPGRGSNNRRKQLVQTIDTYLMPRPIDVVTNETLQFVLRSIPSRNSRVLEVGCGNGDLAYELANLGHEVVAIDSSREQVTEAGRRGVDARVADFLDFKEDLFDVILFTRSLHHIQPLRPALARAHTLIKPG